MIINVGKDEYRIKFGYKALSKSGVLKEVMAMQKRIAGTEVDPDIISDILEILADLLLAGLQKYHEEFAVDYDSPQSLKEGNSKVSDLLDEYMDDESSADLMQLFTDLTTELFNNGFLSKVSQKQEALLTQTDSTVVPQGSKRKKN